MATINILGIPQNGVPSERFIVLELLRFLNVVAKFIGVNYDFSLLHNSDNGSEENPRKSPPKMKIVCVSCLPLVINLVLQLASAALVSFLLYAIWADSHNTQVFLHFLTFLEISLATILQGMLCFALMAFRTNKNGENIASFKRLNSLLTPCEVSVKKTTSRFTWGFIVSFVIQTTTWIAMITANYPKDHPFLSVWPNRWVISAVIYIGIVSMMISQYLYQACYLMLVYVLGMGFETLGSKLEMSLAEATSNTIDNDDWLSRRLLKIRRRYQYSVELALKNDQTFSPTLLTGLLTNSLIAAVSLYQMLVNIVYEAKLSAGLMLGAAGVVSLCWICALCLVPHSSGTKASASLTAVFSAPLPAHLPASLNEIKIIAIKISGPPVTFTASEFVSLNRSSFIQIASVCVTYVVGMLQFREERS